MPWKRLLGCLIVTWENQDCESRHIPGYAGFGSPEWAEWAISVEAAMPILKAAWDAGIQTFDTANIYSNGMYTMSDASQSQLRLKLS